MEPTEDVVEEIDLGLPSSLVGTLLPVGEHEALARVETPPDRLETGVLLGDGEDAWETEEVERCAACLHDKLVGEDEEGGFAKEGEENKTKGSAEFQDETARRRRHNEPQGEHATHESRYASISSPSTKESTLHFTISSISSQTSRGTRRRPSQSDPGREAAVDDDAVWVASSATVGANQISRSFSGP